MEEEPQTTTKPYQALMQSLAEEKQSAPQAKRRKLDHHVTADRPMTEISDEESDSDAEAKDLDFVEEAEEGPETEVFLEDEDSDDEDLADPFETHIVNPDQAEVEQRLKAIKSKDYATTQTEVNGWRLTISTPGSKTKSPQPSTFASPSSLKLKKKLVETSAKLRPNFDKLEQVLYPLTFGYQDLLFCGRTARNAQSLRRMYCMHAVNHVFK